ncbi:LysR family transcriptional regulator [Vibrio astriarenae]|uniref:LysR family transcriptional regulator n=1 Tax=Vibrio astriarenae TaxID=1481923 RepID=UPI003737054D
MVDKTNIKKWDLNLLRVFVVVYKLQNLKRASELVGLSAPSLSLKLAKLKEQIGAELFFKTSKGFEPTDIAHKLFQQVEPLLSRLDDALENVKGFQPADIEGAIVVDLGQHFAPWLPLSLHNIISEQSPNAYLIADYFTRDSAVRLRRAEVELGIQFDQVEEHKDILSLKIGEVEGCFLVRDGHPLSDSIETVEQAIQYGFAMYEQNITAVGSNGLFIEALEQATIPYKIRFKSPSALTVHEILKSTDFVLPTALPPKRILPKGLRAVTLKDERFKSMFQVNAYIYQENRYSERCKWLVDMIKSVFLPEVLNK